MRVKQFFKKVLGISREEILDAHEGFDPLNYVDLIPVLQSAFDERFDFVYGSIARMANSIVKFYQLKNEHIPVIELLIWRLFVEELHDKIQVGGQDRAQGHTVSPRRRVHSH